MAEKEYYRGRECKEHPCGWVRSEGEKECDTCTKYEKPQSQPAASSGVRFTGYVCSLCGCVFDPTDEARTCRYCSHPNTPAITMPPES